MPQLQRRATAITDGPIDWGTGEILAFGSLLMDGRPVRLSGQDSRRGTFVQRFATIIDRRNADEWTPLANLSEDQAQFYVYDSLLSEYAAMGFEYGYSVARPDALVLWEAQFGDFVNGAQIVIDEFITAGETKWRQQSGVVLLLPHGYEGQGPDHSSARIERFLTMGADEAFVVAQPSSPASYFHLLRQHSLGEEHRPLIVFTPKSMLKRKEAASQPADFAEGTFQRAIPDAQVDPDRVEKVLLCSGRITWDLMTARKKQEGENPTTAIVRIEQLYPRPVEEIKAELGRFPNLKEVRWVQDEPANMGPWPHMAVHLTPELDGIPFSRVSRPQSSSPSVGQHSRHLEEQKILMQQAFA
jgi:2-oxoglutarate dehydrogenase E1 component